MTDFTATTSPAIFETNGSTNTWRVSNVGIQVEVGDLPTQTGNGGAVLGTNGTATSWARSFTSPDGETVISAFDGGGGLDWDGAGGAYAYADVDGSIGAYMDASNGTATAQVRANIDGTVEINATGAATLNSHALVVDTDARLTDARTPTAHASSHTDGGSDEIAVALAQLTQSGATTGQVAKWNGSAWAPASESGGGSLPDPTGNEGAVLGTDGSTWAPTRHIESPDGRTWLDVQEDGIASSLTAQDGTESGQLVVQSGLAELAATDGTNAAYVDVHSNGTLDLTATGAATVTPGDGFHVVGSVGETVLSGEDYLMSTASDTDVKAPGATFARARGSMVSKSAVTNGDILAYPLYAQGHDGTSLVLAGQITAEVDGTVATGKVPTRIRIATADADGVLTDRMTIGADGTTDVLGDFTVNGSPVSGGGGGGGLVLVDSGTFAAASSLSLPDDSFDSSAHDDYRLIVDWINAGGSGGYENYLRMRGGGADNTAASYATSGIYHGGATGHKTNTAQTAFTGLFDGFGSGDFSRLVLDILRPAEAAYTTISGHRIYTYGGTVYGATLTGLHAVASAFDALTIVSASGTLTGRWALYGYAK